MNTLKTILLSTLVLSVSAIAMTAKLNETNKTVYEVLEGSTMNKASKRGLPVEVAYKSEHVNVGEVSNVNITITSILTEGTLKVSLTALDDELIGLEEEVLEFKLSKERKSFPIALKVGSATEGIHYINLIASVEGEGSRVIAIPVNVGKIMSKVTQKATETTAKGMVVSVSSAEEEIK